MSHLHIFCRLGALAGLLFASGCATTITRRPRVPVPEPAMRLSHWQDEAVTGEPSILIDLSEQRAHFFKGQKEVGQAVISSGKQGFETPTGDFKVIQRDKDHVSNLYGDFVDEAGVVVKSNVDITRQKPPEGASFRGAKMPYFLRFHDGAGMHAGRVPTFRASHGCVRLPGFMAKHFFENAPFGTPVTVTNQSPVSGTVPGPAKKAPTEPAKRPAKTPAANSSKRAKTPPKPAQTTPPAPAPESGKKPDAEPEKKPEPAEPPPAPPAPVPADS